MYRRKKHHISGFTVLFVFLFIVAATAAGYLGYTLYNTENDLAAFKSQSEASIADLDSRVDELTARALELEAERDEMKVKAAELESERTKLIESYSTSDDRYAELSAQLTALNEEIAERDVEIEMLNNSIATLEKAYSIDINAQLDVIKTLEELLHDVPKITEKKEVKQSDGTTKTVTTKRTPTIALYYEDIENGYKYSYRGDVVYDSASCLKAPFALSLLKAADDEIAKLPEGTDLASTELFYDFTGKSLTYTASMSETGTGKIKDGEEGAVYTHLELIEYMLMYSDNVAYNQLKNAYGIDMFKSLANSLNLTSMKKSLSNMSAVDGGTIMREIYRYIEDANLYSEFLYNSMTNSAHSVMTVYPVRPLKVAHKYGWDTGAYHDMAIVYDEHPFILVIMSDMDVGGDEINEYIQSVVSQVKVLHDNFYSSDLKK